MILLSCIPILPGGTSDNGFECFCKITGTGKSAAVTDINNTLLTGIQHMAGFFNPVMDQILDGGLPDDVAERALYLPFADVGGLSQLLQRYGFRIVVLDIADHFFDMLHFLGTLFGAAGLQFCPVHGEDQEHAGQFFPDLVFITKGFFLGNGGGF